MAELASSGPRLHSDEPTLDDPLCHAAQVDRVAGILARCEPPFVLGVHGDWGSGKTSFLKKLHLRLTGVDVDGTEPKTPFTALWPGKQPLTDQFAAVWFEAWRHQHDSTPIVALLQEIRAHFGWWQKAGDKAAELSFAAAMSLEELTKVAGYQPSKIVEARDQWQARSGAQPLPSQLYRRLLNEAIEKLIGPGKRLVVFIDDLDRCQGEMTFRLLEALKIYLSIPSCVFVLALDVRSVQRSVAAELVKAGMVPEPKERSEQTQALAEFFAADYLAKLFQVVEHLPYLSRPDGFLRSLLEEAGVPDLETWLRLLCDHELLPPNPRKIKAFVNALSIGIAELEPIVADGRPMQRSLVLIATYLRLFANEVYRILESDADFWKVLHGFSTTTDVRTDHPALRKLRFQDLAVPLGADGAGYRYEKLFPDPAQEGLFRVAKLIRTQSALLGNPDFNLYFRRAR